MWIHSEDGAMWSFMKSKYLNTFLVFNYGDYRKENLPQTIEEASKKQLSQILIHFGFKEAYVNQLKKASYFVGNVFFSMFWVVLEASSISNFDVL